MSRAIENSNAFHDAVVKYAKDCEANGWVFQQPDYARSSVLKKSEKFGGGYVVMLVNKSGKIGSYKIK